MTQADLAESKILMAHDVAHHKKQRFVGYRLIHEGRPKFKKMRRRLERFLARNGYGVAARKRP